MTATTKINRPRATRYTFGVNGAGSNPLQMVELQLLDPDRRAGGRGPGAHGGRRCEGPSWPRDRQLHRANTNDTLDLFGSDHRAGWP